MWTLHIQLFFPFHTTTTTTTTHSHKPTLLCHTLSYTRRRRPHTHTHTHTHKQNLCLCSAASDKRLTDETKRNETKRLTPYTHKHTHCVQMKMAEQQSRMRSYSLGACSQSDRPERTLPATTDLSLEEILSPTRRHESPILRRKLLEKLDGRILPSAGSTGSTGSINSIGGEDATGHSGAVSATGAQAAATASTSAGRSNSGSAQSLATTTLEEEGEEQLQHHQQQEQQQQEHQQQEPRSSCSPSLQTLNENELEFPRSNSWPSKDFRQPRKGSFVLRGSTLGRSRSDLT